MSVLVGENKMCCGKNYEKTILRKGIVKSFAHVRAVNNSNCYVLRFTQPKREKKSSNIGFLQKYKFNVKFHFILEAEISIIS